MDSVEQTERSRSSDGGGVVFNSFLITEPAISIAVFWIYQASHSSEVQGERQTLIKPHSIT